MASASSTSPSFLEVRDEELQTQTKPQQQQQSSLAPPPAKKRRNQPGNPTDPDAEVIALSPKTLLATNRFICEVCNKGFQREQNLQLHRRGHNLPWKLRLKSTKEVRRRVYLCPEPSCVHHDPARALGDLTGIKKHFCRKHGEKKWKCDKCAKRYAVHSDLKAHAKTCGTREYRCDCGTLFSRRDSFITHRAFCDALAQESSRLPTVGGLAALGSHLYGNNSMALSLSQVNAQLTTLQAQSHASAQDLLRLGSGAASGGVGGGSQFEHLMTSLNHPSQFRPPPSAPGFFLGNGSNVQDFSGEHQPLLQSKPFHGLMQLPDLHGNANGASSNLFNLGFFSSTNGSSNNGGGGGNNQLLIGDDEPTTLFSGALMSDQMTSLYNAAESILPRMSATALLQKAAQMGSSTTNGGGDSGGGSLQVHMDNETNLQNLMNSLANGDAAACSLFVGSAFGGGNQQDAACRGFGGSFSAGLHNLEETKFAFTGVAAAADDRLTRDFLGVGGMVRSISGGISRRDQVPNHGIDMSVLDPK